MAPFLRIPCKVPGRHDGANPPPPKTKVPPFFLPVAVGNKAFSGAVASLQRLKQSATVSFDEGMDLELDSLDEATKRALFDASLRAGRNSEILQTLTAEGQAIYWQVDAGEVARLHARYQHRGDAPERPEPRIVNTTGQRDNCYYVTVAVLTHQNVDELIRRSGYMQIAGGGSLADIEQLCDSAGLNTRSGPHSSLAEAEQHMLEVNGAVPGRFGLVYRRHNGTGHVVVANFEGDGDVTYQDYQVNPAGADWSDREAAEFWLFSASAGAAPGHAGSSAQNSQPASL